MTEERLSLASERLREIPQETAAPEPFRTYFQRAAEFLLSVTKDADPERFPADILPEHYETSFADPDYAARILGTEFGPLLSAVYTELRGYISAFLTDDAERCAILLELFLEIYGEFYGEELPHVSTIRGIFAAYLSDYLPYYLEKRLMAETEPAAHPGPGLIPEADLVTRSPGLWEEDGRAVYNRQYACDHREDLAAALDDRFVSHYLRCAQELFEAYGARIRRRKEADAPSSGGVRMEMQPHGAALAFTAKQKEQMVRLREGLYAIRSRYSPE